MKQRIIFSFFCVVFFDSLICINVSAQYTDPVMSPYWEFYSTNSLSTISAGKGNTGVASSGDVGLIYLNPATLNISKKFQINAGYNLKSGSGGLSQNFYSFSIAGAYRFSENFQAGLAYQNDYSYKYSPTIVLNFPDTNTFETHSFRIPVVYRYKRLSIGINLNLIYFKGLYHNYINESLWKLNPEIGVIVSPIKQFSFGASFIPGFTSYPNIVNTKGLGYTYTTIVKYPNRFKVGTEFRSSNNDTKFTFDYHYAKTSVIGLNDRNEIHLGFEHLLDENWAFRCGLFSNQSHYDDKIYFLTFGTSFKLHNFSFNLAGMVSMAGNSGRGEYYVLNFGAGYEF